MPTRRPNDDLEARVTALEQKVRDIARDAAAARVLAGAADRDVSDLRTELRGHTTVLNALRETQLEQGQQIATQGQQIATQGQQIAAQGQQIADLRTEMRDGFTKVNVGMAQITALLTNKISGARGVATRRVLIRPSTRHSCQ